MARIQQGSILSGIRGKIGGVVIKRYWSGTIVISKVPDMSNVTASEKQTAKRNLFKEAVAYAQQVIRDPKQKAALRKKLKRGRSVYHAAVAAYMKKHRNTRS